MFGWFPPLAIHRELTSCHCILALGGDNLSFDYGLFASLLFFSPFDKAVKLGVPSVIWGGSIGPFNQKPAWEKRFARILRSVDLITVREPLTQAYLAELGVEDNIRMVADPAFLLPDEPVELPKPLETALQSGAVGLNIAPLMRRYNGQSSRQWFGNALEMLQRVVERVDAPIVLIPHVMMSPNIFPSNDDYEFMKLLCDEMLKWGGGRKMGSIVLYDARQHTCKQIKWVISRLRAFAGCRTHATIAALSSGVPTFCIGYSVKSRGINQDLFGHENWVAHFSELTGARLAERIAELLNEETNIRTHLSSIMPDYVAKAWLGGEFLSEMLKRKGGVK
jgi:polysaccharide pyruvyl transferase WcaK-like protein